MSFCSLLQLNAQIVTCYGMGNGKWGGGGGGETGERKSFVKS